MTTTPHKGLSPLLGHHAKSKQIEPILSALWVLAYQKATGSSQWSNPLSM
jgi:hypothetical protein